MSGCVAAGSPVTVNAGLQALRLGGNAVDAAVAAQLCACVAEPLLTGLGGGGLATVCMDGEVEVCDLFATVPARTGPMDTVVVDFGPTTQAFHVGPASVAVPGLPQGLWAMHKRWGRLPFRMLAQPAIAAAQTGVEVSLGLARVNELLWPIQAQSAEAGALFGREGRPLGVGDIVHQPVLADTLRAFVDQGPDYFATGAAAQALLRCVPTLDPGDLARWRPVFRKALGLRYRDMEVLLPGPPSQGGPQILRSLLELSRFPMPVPFGPEHVRRIAASMDIAERSRPEPLVASLFEEGFAKSYLGAGFTTQVSVVDGHGNAVALTTSLGESSGLVVPETGVIPNNFMGEEDVNPPGQPRPVGARLMTMCSPCVVRGPGRIYALGSGGSSRIRSAVLHGVVYLVDHGLHPEEAATAPRCHMEEGCLRVETFGRPAGIVEALELDHPGLLRFPEHGMYFGGLHIAGLEPDGFHGGGDPRRSGDYAELGSP